MKKLRAFFYSFRKSISSLSYYNDVVKAPFSFSLKYFLFFSLTLGFLLTAILSFVAVPPVHRFVKRFETRAPALYPNDLVITIKDGQLSTNVAEPLRFPVPYELFTETPGAISDQNQAYLVTIDTTASVDDYDESQSAVLITKENVVIADDNGYRVYPLKDFGDVTITKTGVDSTLSRLKPFLRIFPVLMVVFIFVALALILPLSRLLSLFILSFIVHVASRLMKLNLTYKKVFQLGLHALTLPTLIQILMITLDLNPPIPFFNSILFILYSLVILAELHRSPTLRSKK